MEDSAGSPVAREFRVLDLVEGDLARARRSTS